MKKNELQKIKAELEKNPDNIPLMLRYGKMLIKAKQLKEAEAQFTKVLKQDKDNIQAKLNLADIHFANEKYSTVIVIAEELIHKKMASEKLKILHIKALLKQNSLEEAKGLYRKLLEENPFIFDEELMDLYDDLPEMYEAEEDEDDEDNLSWLNGDDDDDDDEEGEDFIDNPFNRGYWDHLENYEGGAVKETFENLEQILVIKEGFDRFEYYAGLESAKIQLFNYFKLIKSAKDPYFDYGIDQRFSVCLYGPPSNGKTSLIKCIPEEFGVPMIPIGALVTQSSGGADTYLAMSFAFNYVSAIKPTSIVIDNIDEMAGKHIDREVKNKLYQHLDGIKFDLEDVGIITATNKPWNIDEDTFRYKRIDELIFIAPPNRTERKTFLTGHMSAKLAYLLNYLDTLLDNSVSYTYGELSLFISKLAFRAYTQPRKKINKDEMLSILHKIIPVYEGWIAELDTLTKQSRMRPYYEEALQYKLN